MDSWGRSSNHTLAFPGCIGSRPAQVLRNLILSYRVPHGGRGLAKGSLLVSAHDEYFRKHGCIRGKPLALPWGRTPRLDSSVRWPEWDPCQARIRGNRDCERGYPSADAGCCADGLRKRPIADRGKVALVTGVDSGIGRAVCYHFVKEGATVAFTFVKGQEDKDADDTLHVLLENKTSDAKNPIAVGADLGHALKHMKEGGTIINTTSVNAYSGNPKVLDYTSTKGAIVSFTRALALQLVQKGIRVNRVAPGPVYTPIQPASMDASYVSELGSEAPMNRVAQPYEIAQSFVFLACDGSSYFTGQVLHPNGMHSTGLSFFYLSSSDLASFLTTYFVSKLDTGGMIVNA
ncbi:glucose and ribitol dehydrogenase [Tanacetum coccineum]